MSLALVFLPITTVTNSLAVVVHFHPAAALLLALQVPLAAAMPLVILSRCLEVLPPAALPLPLERLAGPLARLPPAAAAALPLALAMLPTAPPHYLEVQHPAATLLLVAGYPPSAVVLLHSLETLPLAALPLPLNRVAGPLALRNRREMREQTDRL